MCGRFTLRTPLRIVVEQLGLFPPELEDAPRYNIAPTQDVRIVRQAAGGRELHTARWGLVPAWAADPKKMPLLINARAETVAEKPTFREPFRRRRCLLLADGFYEWKTAGKSKQPYFFRLAGGRPFAFAALWEPRHPAMPLDSCALVTTSANQVVAPIHDRMPVILPMEAADEWLDPHADAERLCELLVPYTGEMESWAVSTVVNNARHETAECVEPA